MVRNLLILKDDKKARQEIPLWRWALLTIYG